jgi:hypothetical protein
MSFPLFSLSVVVYSTLPSFFGSGVRKREEKQQKSFVVLSVAMRLSNLDCPRRLFTFRRFAEARFRNCSRQQIL